MILQFPLGDQIVCFDDQSERLNVANLAGARILELYESGVAHEHICETLFAEFDADKEQIDQDVRTFVQHWQSGDVTQFSPAQTHVPDTQYVPDRPLQSVGEMLCHLPTGTFKVRSESAAVIELLQPMFGLSENIVQTPQHLIIEIFEEDGLYPIVYNGHTVDTGYSIESAAILCHRAVNVLVSFVESHAITLHAAAVSLGVHGALFSARGGSGKTTLTTYLMSQGYELINDDAIHLSADPIHLVPIPVALSIKKGSWPVVAQWFPKLMQQKIYAGVDTEIRYLPLADDQACSVPVRCNVVFFPRYRISADTRVLPIDQATALTMLIDGGCYLPKPVEAAHVERLVCWAQELEFYSLEYSSVQEAELIIRKMLLQ